MSDEPIPACAVVNFEMGVPPAALALALVLVPAFGLFVTAFHMPD